MVPSARSWLSCHNNVGVGKRSTTRYQFVTMVTTKVIQYTVNVVLSCSFLINAVENIS